MRDDHPFGSPAPPAAIFYAASNRRGEHPQRHLGKFSGILQSGCYNGFNLLFGRTKIQMPVTPVFCFAHARMKFFELADVSCSALRGKGSRPPRFFPLNEPINVSATNTLECTPFHRTGRLV